MNLIDGKLIAKEIKEKLKEEIFELKKKNIVPGLAIILVGNDPASEIYVRNKIKTCEELSILVELYRFDENNEEEEIILKIKELNNDPRFDGILVQSPLPKKFHEDKIVSYVTLEKDVDGFGIYNLGSLLSSEEYILAATPLGILKMLEHEHVSVLGKHVVMVGSSKIVGRPMAIALLNRGATVTIANSKTQHLKEITKQADILIVAIGHANYITEEYVKDGVVVIDVGINRIDGKVVGDVDWESVSKKASYITPVPGGVGPMTIAMLLNNIVVQAKRRDLNGFKN
ncbi:bifunctional protein FolD [Mycoplasma sp. CAG:776]|nr:bifunctional protein FolD [Mycoplasma sp. CAG:776]